MSNKIIPKVVDLFSSYSAISYKKKEHLLKENDPIPGIFYLKKGTVKQYISSRNGEMLNIHLFRPGSFFLNIWLVGEKKSLFNFIALNNVEVAIAPILIVRKFLSDEPEVLFDFTTRLLKGLDGFLQRFKSVMEDQAYDRVRALLYYIGKKFGEKTSAGIVIKIPLIHQEIASWIGTTRETASLQMEKLKKEGIISYKGRKLIINKMDLLSS